MEREKEINLILIEKERQKIREREKATKEKWEKESNWINFKEKESG